MGADLKPKEVKRADPKAKGGEAGRSEGEGGDHTETHVSVYHQKVWPSVQRHKQCKGFGTLIVGQGGTDKSVFKPTSG